MSFRDVVGHRLVIDLLARSIRNDSLPPSLLFAGPAAAAKRDTAIAVAQALNCTQSPVARHQSPDISHQTLITKPAGRDNRLATEPLATDSCGRCSACVRIARGMHPDVLIVEPGDSGSIKIEQVREVVDRSSYRPFEGRRRVVIVDDAAALMAPAQNALLKTLEEPPSSSVFILLTARPDVLLPTVRSRLIRLAFAEGGQGDDDAEARDVAERVLARAAGGGDAGRRLEAAKDLLVNTGAGGASDREQLASHLRAIAVMLRDVAVLGTGASDRLLARPENRRMLDRLKPIFGAERGLRAFFAVDRGLAALERNAGVKIVADWVAVQL